MSPRPTPRSLGFLLALIILPFNFGLAIAQSSYSWSSGTSNNWGSTQWTRNSGTGALNGPPGAADNATISVGGTYTVSVTSASTINNLTLSGANATLLIGPASGANAGPLTVNGAFALDNGSLDNTNDGLTLNGAFNWGGGTLGGGTVKATHGGTVAGGVIDGSSSVLKMSAGTWTWGSGNIAPNNGGKLQIDAGATLQLTADRSFGSTAAVGGVVDNAGLITKTGGASSSWIGNLVTLNNTGTLRVTSGSWNVQGGTLNNSGVIDLGTGTFMSVHTNGVLVLNDGSSITGGGPLSMTDGSATITVNGNVTSAGGLQIQRGVLNGTGTLTLNGSFDLGYFDSNSVMGLTVNAAAGGNWTGSDTPRIGTGAVNITGGTVTWSGSPISFVGNGALTVGANGTLNLTGDENISVSSGFSPTVTINGLFKKSGGTSNSTINSLVNLNVGSTGTIDGQSGNLIIRPAAVTNNGVIKASTGQIEFNTASTLSGSGTLASGVGGTLFVNAGAGKTVAQSGGFFTNVGTLNVSSGTFTVSDAVTITNFDATSHTLTGGLWKVGAAKLDLGSRTITTIAAGTTVELGSASTFFTGLTSLTQVNGNLRLFNSATLTPLSSVTTTGTVDVSGTFGGNLTVASGGTLTGNGTLNGGVTVQTGGIVTPGPGPYAATGTGILKTGNLTLQGGSQYTWEINSWATNASAGGGFDQLKSLIAGSKLNLNGASSSNPILIKITSLNGTSLGQMANYDPSVGHDWVIADYANGNSTGGIVGFSADKFTLDTSAFGNDSNSTRFFIHTDANSNQLILSFTPVPEPVMPLSIGVVCVGIATWLRKRNRR